MVTDPPEKLLVLIPAFNEVAHVAEVVRGARAHLPVLVVDDGSSDGTASVAESMGATVIGHPTNRGKGAALRSGFAWALEHGFDAVVMMDADGQHDSADIAAFVAAYGRGQADLLIGARDFGRMPLVRRISNSVGRVVLGWALGQPMRDNQCGFRMLGRKVIESLRPRAGGFEFEVEMIGQAIAAGHRLGWVPIRTIYASERSHIKPFRHALRFLLLAARLRSERIRGPAPGGVAPCARP